MRPSANPSTIVLSETITEDNSIVNPDGFLRITTTVEMACNASAPAVNLTQYVFYPSFTDFNGLGDRVISQTPEINNASFVEATVLK